ncbi:MAG: threonine--tRNA ligase [Gammaproteobacteria bacterium]|nr:threonine--tRNA ligase [Gammaproteobacteria bacterium]
MPVITLPDGSQRHFEQAVTVRQVAESIGAGLAKAALAARVDGREVDTSHLIESDIALSIITARDADGIEVIRHSTAHLLAQAVKQLFPTAQVTIGPVIEDGFYYDFSYERPFTPDDLERIERKMEELASANQDVSRRVMPRDDAAAYFRSIGERYKAEIIESIPANEDISLYSQGEFTDLCRGPHVPNTGHLRAFKLMKIAGAYWRGDSRNEMLQRIYGTAWPEPKALAAYLKRLEEAEKRDHRRLGRQLDLFHFQEEAPGMVFWHPRGWTVWQQIERYMRDLLSHKGYQEVRCPLILDANLWRKSGHWENFHENMFTTESESREYAVKPMNCPGHVQIYNQGIKSYRDLPLRLAEFGSCHRNEPSGALHGLMRVRAFTQDDGHIFCMEEQIQDEVSQFIDLLQGVYRDFGFDELQIKLSTRPAKRVGSDETWDKAEAALKMALDGKNLEWDLQPGEGAFYGPKIEFSLRDSIGRVWQCGTIQLDFSMPDRLGAEFVADDNSRRTPVMLHRAILGSMERFIGILIEHFSGYLPVWLAPCQAVVANISERQAAYAAEVAEMLKNQGFRVESDLRNEKIGLKIRDHTLQRTPYLLVVGDREVELRTVAVRSRRGDDIGVLPIDEFAQLLSKEIVARTIN